MPKMIINGGHELEGTIKISGAKNSVVALIPASILYDNSNQIYTYGTIKIIIEEIKEAIFDKI